jgi:RNA polymerase sigma-70 factor (ECF subfamily)
MVAGRLPSFEDTIVPHLGAAYNLARWITRNPQDAEDLAQESYLKAFRFFDDFRGVDGRGWLLAIVRNTCLTWLRKENGNEPVRMFDERIHSGILSGAGGVHADAERALLAQVEANLIRQCIEELPLEYREVLAMRELQEMSYKEIAGAAQVPMGTIMSRLSRGRKQLEAIVAHRMDRKH